MKASAASRCPDDRPVPGFLDSWMFYGVAMPAASPPGFNLRAARVGVRYNGFYLFQTTGLAGPTGPIRQLRHSNDDRRLR
jgi:hypothetical protein